MKPTNDKFSESELEDFLWSEIPQAEQDWEKRKKLMDAFYADYRDVKPAVKRGPYGNETSNYSIPLTSTSADAIIPRIIEGIFDFAQPIQVRAVSQEAKPLRDRIVQFLKWDIDSHPDYRRAIWNWISAAVSVGTGYVKTVFTKEYKYDKVETFDQPADPTSLPSEDSGAPAEPSFQTVRRLVKYIPETFTVHYNDVIFPKGVTSLLDAWENSWVAVRVWRTKDELRRMLRSNSRLLKNVDRIKIQELEDRINEFPDLRSRQAYARQLDRTKKIETFEVYINWDVDDDGLSEKIVCLFHLESKQLLGFEMFPYRHDNCPVQDSKIKEIDFDPFGVGVSEMLYDTKGLLDVEFNTRSDRLRYTRDPVFLYTEASGFNPKKHKKELGAHWMMDAIDPANFKVLEINTSEMESYRFEDRIRGYAQRRTSVYDSTLGSLENQMPANRTATGVQAIFNEGNIQFRHFMRYIILSITEIFKQRLSLYRQYWVDEVDEEGMEHISRILSSPDNPLDELTLDAIQYEYDISLQASTHDKERELRLAQAVLELVLKVPLFSNFPPKMMEAAKDYFRKLGINSPESMVPTNEEIMAWQAEIQKQAIMKANAEKEKERLKEIEQDTYKKEMLRGEVMQEIEQELGSDDIEFDGDFADEG